MYKYLINYYRLTIGGILIIGSVLLIFGSAKIFAQPVIINLPSGSVVKQILFSGQSLSEGYNATPSISTVARDNVWTLSGMTQENPEIAQLIEGVTDFPNTESPLSGMGRMILDSGAESEVIMTRHGIGATAYRNLKYGTSAFSQGLNQVTQAKAVLNEQNLILNVPVVSIVHGESDQIEGSSQQYTTYLEEWQSDYNREITAITGQSNPVIMFTDQMSTFNIYNPIANRSPEIPLQQLKASEDNPTKIILVGPKYQFDYTDQVHLTGQSSKLLGEYYGKVYKEVITDKKLFKPLSPVSITRIDDMITVRYNQPSGTPLSLDTDIVAKRDNYGFSYTDNTIFGPSIKEVKILDDNTVAVQLTRIPTGRDERLSYATIGQTGIGGGRLNSQAIGGNLRDNDITTGESGVPLYNWGVIFDKQVTNISTTVNLTVKAILSGAWDPSLNKMKNNLSLLSLLPDQSNLPANIDPENIVDWVTVELKPVDTTSQPIVIKAILQTDGTIKLNNIKLFTNQEHYIILKHRNHLGISSKLPIKITSQQDADNLIDLTDPVNIKSQNLIMINSLIGGLKKGNSNSDNRINAQDRVIVRSSGEMANVYSNLDLNLDGRLNAQDRSIARAASEGQEVL